MQSRLKSSVLSGSRWIVEMGNRNWLEEETGIGAYGKAQVVSEILIWMC